MDTSGLRAEKKAALIAGITSQVEAGFGRTATIVAEKVMFVQKELVGCSN